MRVATKSAAMTRATAGGALAIVLLLAAPAFACTPQADFKAAPASAAPGATVGFTGNNFDPDGMPVKIRWNEAGSESGRVLFSVAPDAAGRFNTTATIPADARPGYYDVRATQTRSDGTLKVDRKSVV